MNKKQIDYKKVFKNLVIVYFMLSPIFDLLFLYNHITTLIRVLFLLIFVVITVILYKDSRKKFMWLLAYYLALGVYLIISVIHSYSFNSLIPNSYSLVSEASTLLKLAMPFTILFILYYQKLSRKDFFKVINLWAIIIAGSIVICNLFGYSLGSYTNEITKYSIFSWGKGLSVYDTATKGFFAFANQETLVLILLLVLAIYEFIFVDKRSIILIILIALASLMLGTRISTLGGILVLCTLAIFYFVYFLISKRKICKSIIYLIPIIVFWLFMIPISPNNSRLETMESVKNDIIEMDQKGMESNVIEEKIEQDYIPKTLDGTKLLNREFYLEFYPYQYDEEFWMNIITNNINDISNYRFMEKKIIKRVWDIDNRKSNIMFGISNSRIQNIVNIENDIILHFFAFGIVGSIICLLYYPIMLLKSIKSVFKKWQAIDISILACISLYLLSALIAGNAINFLATIVPIAFIMSHQGAFKD